MSATDRHPARATGARWWLAGASLLLVLTIGWGTFNVVDVLAHEERTEVHRFDQPITAVEIRTGQGSVRVIATDGETTVLNARISEGLRRPEVAHQLVGDRLVASASCPSLGGTWCSVSFVVEVPEGTAVYLRSGHGSLRVTGAVGPIDALTRHGDVTVDGPAETLDVRSRHGDVTLSLVAPRAVRADTRHGDVELVLADDPGAYRVELRTGDGSTVNSLRTDPASERLVELSTGHGDVVARYGP